MKRTAKITIMVIVPIFLMMVTGCRKLFLSQNDIFVSGTEGYHTFRIPAVIFAPDGTVLAFCEGRKQTSSDTGDIDIVLKRSFDSGKTWQTMEVIWDDGENVCGNPCPVIEQSKQHQYLQR